MISEALNIVWEFAKEKGLEFKVQIEPDVPQRLWGDDIRIEQILLNIIGNAIKYTEKGSVTFKVQCRRHDDRSCDMIFSVTDTGIGIKRERLNQIFDEFVRVGGSETKNEIGTGLGLSIAKQLTEQMNGEIKVNSIYTKGSTFVITIPQGIRKEDSVGIVDIQTLRSHEEAAVYRQSFEAPGARILIVDDNSLNRKATVKLLRDTKIIIDQEKSGQGCLERCANTHYDCIFLDQEMPEMDGIECIRQIRSQVGGLSRETPIVVITAFSSPDDRNRFRMAGFDGYLPKPVSGEMLENTLLRLLPAERVHRTSEEDQGLEVIKKEKEKIPILITTESACDLPKELLDKMGIPIVHFYIKNKNGSFIDDVEVDTEGILKYMSKDGGYDMAPDTPTVDDFEKFFAEHLVEAENIIHISMSSKTSGAFWCSSEAAKAFDNVTIIDSESLSCGMGTLVLEAHRMVEAGASVLECVEQLNRIKKRIHISYFVNDMEYLVRLGRVKRKLKGVGRIFMIRPAITFRDGRGTLLRMLIGSVEFAKKKYISVALSNPKDIDKSKVFIIHTGLQVTELDDICRWVKELVPFSEVVVQRESAAMAAIHGPGAFGVSFMYNEE
jgi:DegV family protein with EDD domain